MLGGESCSSVLKRIIYLYMGLRVIVLVATNLRRQMIAPIIIAIFCFLLIQIYKKTNTYFITARRVILMVFFTIVLTGPASDMAFAMVVARNDRDAQSFTELLKTTYDIYSDKDNLSRLKILAEETEEEASHDKMEWNESYVSNLYFNRFCNYHVVDASINLAFRVGFMNSEMLEDFWCRLKCLLPQFIVTELFSINKRDINYSVQDKLYALSYYGIVLGGYRVGGDVGLGLATFGYFYFFLEFLVYTMLFFLVGSLLKYENGSPLFSVIFLLNIYFTYFLLLQVSKGIVAHVCFVIFSFWWTTLFQLLIYKIVLVFGGKDSDR